MPDSSADSAAMLTRVRPRHACNLLAIVHGASHRGRSFIAARYAEGATHFEETVAFLEDMGWLRADSGTLEPTSDVTARIVAADGALRSLLFAEAALDGAGQYRHVLARYLSQFERIDGAFIHRPNVEARLRDAGVRDFFMDLGAVTHRPDGDFFVLEEPFAACVLWARNLLSPSPGLLARRAEERLALGHRAELLVFDWERDRVGHPHQHRVRHVARENPAACFDIHSVTVPSSGELLPRFIEVKAVALDTFEFHWSRPEIEAAAILGDRYFLYLLPVTGVDAFDLTQMETIQDAYAEVCGNPSKWSTAAADTVCRKRDSLAL